MRRNCIDFGELSLRQGEQEGEREEKKEKIAQSPIHPLFPRTVLPKALEIARCQQAKSLELRAAMSLARLWWTQGKDTEARHLLEEIYGWFTEGFGTKDLQEAEALLLALGGTVTRTGEERRKAEEGKEGKTG